MSPKTKKYFVKARGEKEATPVDLEIHEGGRYVVRVAGVPHEVDAFTLPHGAVSLLVDGRSFGVEFDERREEIEVLVKNQLFHLDVADERKMRLRAANTAFSVEGPQTISAPMPGKIVKVLVKVGDEVKEGQGLVVVEAMKMENELKSPKAGKVSELLAKEGSPVEQNAKLVVVV